MTQARLTPNVLQISATVRSSAELSIIPSVILMGGHACRPTISNSMANARDLASAAIPSTIRHLISKLKILPACGMVADSKNVLWTSLWPTMPGRVRSRLTVSLYTAFVGPQNVFSNALWNTHGSAIRRSSLMKATTSALPSEDLNWGRCFGSMPICTRRYLRTLRANRQHEMNRGVLTVAD